MAGSPEFQNVLDKGLQGQPGVKKLTDGLDFIDKNDLKSKFASKTDANFCNSDLIKIAIPGPPRPTGLPHDPEGEQTMFA